MAKNKNKQTLKNKQVSEDVQALEDVQVSEDVQVLEDEDHEFYEKWKRDIRVSRRREGLQNIGGIPKANLPNDAELHRMLVTERSRFLSALSRNTITVWLYNRKVLRGLIYALLLMYSDNERECFPPALNGFNYVDDEQILEHSFSPGDFWFPSACLCVVMLGIAKRNGYLTEILNSFVRRRMNIYKQRTIFLFEGTRQDFTKIYGEVSTFELNRDAYIIDWNADASAESNKSRHVNENVRSFTEKSSQTQPRQESRQESSASDTIYHRDSKKTGKSSSDGSQKPRKGKTHTTARLDVPEVKLQQGEVIVERPIDFSKNCM